MAVAAVGAVAVAAVRVAVAVVMLLVVEESHGTIIGLKIARFCNFLKRHNEQADGRMDRPSFRDARTHLKTH